MTDAIEAWADALLESARDWPIDRDIIFHPPPAAQSELDMLREGYPFITKEIERAVDWADGCSNADDFCTGIIRLSDIVKKSVAIIRVDDGG